MVVKSIRSLCNILFTLAFFSCTPTEETNFKISEKMDEVINEVLNSINPSEKPDGSIDLIAFSGQEPDTAGTYGFQADINRAIDSLAAAGGGTLVFPYPETEDEEKTVLTYRIKEPIMLKSNIGIKFDRSLLIQFEFDPPAYRPGGKGVLSLYGGTTLFTHSPLIRGFNLENISISATEGEGPLPVINGDGKKWREWEVQGNRPAVARMIAVLPTFVQKKLIMPASPFQSVDLILNICVHPLCSFSFVKECWWKM